MHLDFASVQMFKNGLKDEAASFVGISIGEHQKQSSTSYPYNAMYALMSSTKAFLSQY